MKGPFERLKYDLRRLWECPQCQRRERTDGSFTSRLCACGTKPESGALGLAKLVPMRLVEDGPRRVDGRPLARRNCAQQPGVHQAEQTAESVVPASLPASESVGS